MEEATLVTPVATAGAGAMEEVGTQGTFPRPTPPLFAPCSQSTGQGRTAGLSRREAIDTLDVVVPERGFGRTRVGSGSCKERH